MPSKEEIEYRKQCLVSGDVEMYQALLEMATEQEKTNKGGLMVPGQRVKILRDGRESGYFDGRWGVVAVVLDDMAVVEVQLKSGRVEKWIGRTEDLEVGR